MMSEHRWVQESLALYVAGGMSGAEAARVERHLPECVECGAALEESRALDRRLETLFAPLHPRTNLEETVVQILRQACSRPHVRSQRSRKRRSARPVSGRHKFLIALCVLFFIAAGAVVTGTFLDPQRGFSVAWDQRTTFETVGASMHPTDRSDSMGGAKEKSEMHAKDKAGADTWFSPDVDPARLKPNAEVDVDRVERLGVPGKIDPNATIGIPDGDQTPPPTNLQAPSGFGRGLPLAGTFYGRSGATREGEGKGEQGYYFRPTSPPLADAGKERAKEVAKPSPAATDGALALVQPGAKPPTPEPDVAPTPRKIVIRTGTMLFEVDSYDVAVALVTKLVVETKGAYVNHKDSEKLPNGKVRGTVVVRMPPEALDDFVLKLLREVGKVGELRMQRVNSQDVTKQYTDLESELRGHRTMEERILKIIRDGKGEIKDLLAAERELGVYRTKIEKIEGEMRYYANQAALSTLTIDLVEKEIRQAAVVEEQQRIQTGIEVDDVEKALKDAEAMIEELKGRILVSKLNEHKGGQYSADLQFSVAPENANAMRDRLKQLGTTARLEVDRVASAHGAAPAAARDVKTRRGDSLFVVALYNLAKIEPREIVHVKVAVTDVVAVYNRLRGDVKKLNGREVNAQGGKAHAVLHVDVRRSDDVALLKSLTEAGEELGREQKLRAQDPNTTDAKVQVQIELFDAAAIPPREMVRMTVEVDKVPEVHRKIEALVKQSNGRSLDMDQHSGDKVQILATYDVPLPELAALVREASSAGTVRKQTTTQDTKAPDGKLALGRLQLTLATRAPLVERDETFGAQFRHGVALSLRGLGYSLLWLVVGVLFFVPWLLVAYGCYRLVARMRTTDADEPEVELAPPGKPDQAQV